MRAPGRAAVSLYVYIMSHKDGLGIRKYLGVRQLMVLKSMLEPEVLAVVRSVVHWVGINSDIYC